MGNYRTSSSINPLWYVLAAVVLVILCGVGIGACASKGRTGPGQVAVIRNGGPLDSNTIRGTVAPNSHWEVPGLFSTWHYYPADTQQRFYTISSDKNRSDSGDVDFVQVPTSDGVQVRLDGTTYFKTAFTGVKNDPLLEEFDNQYGTRKFAVPGSGKVASPWEGTDGWNAWLDSMFRPVLDNAIREEIGRFNCADLISSCALIQQGRSGQGPNLTALQQAGAENQKHFQEVQDAIQSDIEKRVNKTLGGQYLQDVQFKLSKVTLPNRVQNAIDRAQASFAQVSEAQAQAEQSKFEAQRLQRLAKQYQKAPALATIDAIKACHHQCGTIILDGTNSSGSGRQFGLNIAQK